MKLVGHIIAGDLRQHRLLIGAWIFIVVGAAVFDAMQPLLDLDARAETALTTVGGLLWVSEVLLGAMLIALVVQTHPVVGSNAFWMTRPIQPDVLLSAKAVLLTSLVVLWPTIVEAIGAVAYHVPILQVIEVAAQSVLYKAMWLAIGAVFAALTRSVARFVIAVGAALVLVAASLAITMAVLVATMESDVQATPSAQTFDDPTGALVMLVLGMGAAALLLLVQYRTRSPFKAVVTGIIAFAASILAALAWPWPLLAPRVDDAHWAEARGRGRLTASAESVKASRNAEGTAARPMWRAVTARLLVEDVEPGWSIHMTLQQAVLRVPGRPELAGAPIGAWLEPGVGGDRTVTHEAIRSVLEVNRLVGRPTPSNPQTVLYLRDVEFRRLVPASGSYTALFQVIPARSEVEAVIQLDVGATYQDGAYRAVFERLTYAPGAALVELRESGTWTVFERRLQPARTYYLRNAARSEAIEGSAEAASSSWGLPFGFHATTDTGAWSGFVARRLKVEFPPPYGLDQRQTLSLDDRWLEGAELVIVRTTQARAFDRRLEIAGFPLKLDTDLADEEDR